MADQKELPERPREGAEGEDGPSKKALKKAAKEAEKAAKKAAAKARDAAANPSSQQAQQAGGQEEDVSKEDYGDLPMVGAVPFKPSGITRQDLSKVKEEGEIMFDGVVVNARKQSAKLGFLNISQGRASIQAVVTASETLSRQMVKYAQQIPPESLVLVHGEIKNTAEPIKSATISDFELHIKKLYTISRAEIGLPIQIEDAEGPLPEEGAEEQAVKEGERPLVSLNTRLNNRYMDLRAKHNEAIFDIKDGVCRLFQQYLWNKGFKLIHTPKLLGAASEGGANVFTVSYFSGKAYLAQSPQLYKQMLITARKNKVMEVGPVFRAENSNTARHLTEFVGLDMEMKFEENYHEVVEVLEGLMLFIFKGLKEEYAEQTELVRRWLGTEKVADFKLPEAGKVPRIPFSEGVKMLRESGWKEADGSEIRDTDDLSTPAEKRLGALVYEKFNTDFYVLDQFPLAVRPFYTMPSFTNVQTPPDGSTAPENLPIPPYSNSYDFFMRGQEIASGAQRIHHAPLLISRMRALGVDPEGPGLKDYVNSFRYGAPPHAGGGFGLERIVSFWLGLPNVRLASLFPRDPGRLFP